MPSYDETLRYLYGLECRGIKPGLERIKALLKELGHPHHAYRSVLVGGTNGKGSTAAFIESVLRRAGVRTGLYTSPHLTRFNERIKVAGVDIGDHEVVSYTCKVRDAAQRLSGAAAGPSFFEFTTAAAFEYFRDKGVDVAVVEVGMGGRWDATNVLRPLVAVITNISLEHERYLGREINDIAWEKAGIVKEKGLVVTGIEDKGPLEVVERVCMEKEATLYRLGADFHIEMRGREGSFDYRGVHDPIRGLVPGLVGAHQVKNAACAIAAVELLREQGFPIEDEHIKEGIKETFWPGRFEVIKRSPLLILDCAHNPQGAENLARTLLAHKRGRIITVLGIMKDKNIEGILTEIVPVSDTVILTSPDVERAAPTGLLRQMLEGYSVKTLSGSTVKDACRLAMVEAGPADTICVTGSVYTVGEARAFLVEERPPSEGSPSMRR